MLKRLRGSRDKVKPIAEDASRIVAKSERAGPTAMRLGLD
jgi:hypothetical protein